MQTLQSSEQQARDILERMGIKDAQFFSSGDVVELANLISNSIKLELERDDLRADAEITRTIRRARGGKNPGASCCCEWSTEEDDVLVQECIPHADVRKERDRALEENERLRALTDAPRPGGEVMNDGVREARDNLRAWLENDHPRLAGGWVTWAEDLWAIVEALDEVGEDRAACDHDWIAGVDNEHITWDGWGYCRKCGSLMRNPESPEGK